MAVSASQKLEEQARQISGALPALLLAAEAVADQLRTGSHGRRRAGNGETFWQFRPYEPGESIQQIDWRQSAKADQAIVREQEWSAPQTALIWTDASASMHFTSASDKPTKAEATQILALALAILLHRSEEFVGSLDGSVPPSASRQSREQLAAWLLSLEASNSSLPSPLVHKKRAQTLWFSDFLDDPNALKTNLASLANAQMPGLLIQVLDPAERDLPYKGRLRFLDLEGEGRWTIQRTQDIRPEYQARFDTHQAHLQSVVSAVGWRLVTLSSHDDAKANLAKLYAVLRNR